MTLSWLVQITITSSIVGLSILISKKVFHSIFTARMHYYVWVLLFMKIVLSVLPGVPESGLSIFNIMPQELCVVEPLEAGYDVAISDITYRVDLETTKVLSVGTPEQKLVKIFDWELIVLSVWIVGSLGLFGFYILTYVIFIKQTKNYVDVFDSEANMIMDELKSELNYTGEIGLLSGGLLSFAFGFFRKMVVIPEGYDIFEIKQILYHEIMHIKYGDIWMNLLIVFIKCLFWYNPVIWICCREARKDMEILCDSRVLEKTRDKKSYAQMLLKASRTNHRNVTLVPTLGNGKSEIVSRVEKIATKNRIGKLTVCAGCLIILLLAIVVLTNKSSEVSATMTVETLNSQEVSTISSEEISNVTIDDSSMPIVSIDNDSADNTKDIETVEVVGEQLIVVINPAHGGDDSGAIVDGVRESELVLNIAEKLNEKLQDDPGISFSMTREEDINVSFDDRVSLSEGADIMLTLHLDAHNQDKKGVSVAYGDELMVEEASYLQEVLSDGLASEGFIYEASNLIILQDSIIPTFIVNLGYMTNDEEFIKIKDNAYREQIAEVLYQYLLQYRLRIK